MTGWKPVLHLNHADLFTGKAEYAGLFDTLMGGANADPSDIGCDARSVDSCD